MVECVVIAQSETKIIQIILPLKIELNIYTQFVSFVPPNYFSNF